MIDQERVSVWVTICGANRREVGVSACHECVPRYAILCAESAGASGEWLTKTTT